jgi:ATP-dependent helicase/nuclease subunit A
MFPMFSTPDQQQRELALDISQSFIVQAPAGSGKTSLLIQRYLALLANCDLPEEILAITFTRKAANEMRTRIFASLTDAANNPLAKAVIERDKNLNWNLLNNPSRLKLQTIDSLCGNLAKQMPISSGLGAQLTILEATDLEQCRLQAARNLLKSLEDEKLEYLPALIALLEHLDNDFSKAEQLLADMLKSRDQWLPHIITKKSKTEMEQSLANIAAEYLANCKKNISAELQTELITLVNFANSNSCENSDIDLWKTAAALLLADNYQWRKTVTKNHGFPADDKPMKQRMLDLLAKLSKNETLRENLQSLLIAPPLKYTEEQWQMIANLLILLKHLAANLKVILQEQNSVDYTEIALAALQALGEDDNPTDLALKLDYKIKHILVDEFQDTSVIQYRLLEKLMAGWQPNDGRTVFLVGDPMQSIYKFREAKVGLFIRAKNYGINSIRLHPLTLTANFRSQSHLVNWVNSTFAQVMPQTDSIGVGAVKFIPAIAVTLLRNQNCTQSDNSTTHLLSLVDSINNANATEGRVNLHAFGEKDYTAEAKKIVAIINTSQKENPEDTIAILVRSRGHLAAIIPELRAANINYQAVELETLKSSSIIQDLLALTKAVLDPADRVSWLAILRAPWCGLTLADLHAVAAEDQKVPLLAKLVAYQAIAGLSTDGKLRLSNLVQVLMENITNRRRKPLAQMVEDIWQALNGSSCLRSDSEQNNAKLYFEILAQFDIAGNLEKLTLFQKRLAELFADNNSQADQKLQIMTIHRAKGLEFDTVIIPGLERQAARDDPKLLAWLERPSAQAHIESDLIFAPIKRTTKEVDPVYNYLRYENQKKDFYETGRLLYVAVTRAKKNLHLLACIPEVIAKNSLLKQIQFCFKDEIIEEPATNTISANKKPILMRRIASEFFTASSLEKTSLPSFPLSFPRRNDNVAKNIGIIIHETLAKLSLMAAETWPQNFTKWHNLWRTKLVQLGTYEDCESHVATIEQAILTTLSDPQGRWILDKNHEAAQSEYALTTIVNSEIKHFRIDRTFIENGKRWIIDYKTELPDNDSETKHLQQLQQYAKLFSEPVCLGLYFPRTAKFVSPDLLI